MTDIDMAAVFGLTTAFRRIAATRMAGLPMNHDGLAVEAVGFRPWDGRIVGVLVLPWAINLVLLPGSDSEFQALSPDMRQRWRFPSGDYDFMGGNESECGPFHFCSLISPVSPADIRDQVAARQLAQAAMDGLFRPPPAQAHADVIEKARLEGRSALATPLSRRGFLLGGRAG
ncbi:MAG: [NiFe]-hydrogenase assembly, chaperone, HybE [Rhodocyclaceae bacterium]|nr:[NiFe]-hydrogenase assembly, chaperone, HybE [Rhodocyclaceae bacterium]